MKRLDVPEFPLATAQRLFYHSLVVRTCRFK